MRKWFWLWHNLGLSANGSRGWTETILYSFQGSSDGANPEAGLIFDQTGNMYGTTTQGGGNGCSAGCGVVFEVRSGTGAGFVISAPAPSPASIAAGGSANTTVTITPGGGFNQSVTLSCGSITLNGVAAATAPPTCKFSPSSLTNGSGTSTLTISTTAASASFLPASTRSRSLFYAVLLPILGMTLIGSGLSSRRKKLLWIVLVCMTITGVLFLAACSGSSNGGGGSTTATPAGTYTISISGSAGSVMNTNRVTLSVQ